MEKSWRAFSEFVSRQFAFFPTARCRFGMNVFRYFIFSKPAHVRKNFVGKCSVAVFWVPTVEHIHEIEPTLIGHSFFFFLRVASFQNSSADQALYSCHYTGFVYPPDQSTPAALTSSFFGDFIEWIVRKIQRHFFFHIRSPFHLGRSQHFGLSLILAHDLIPISGFSIFRSRTIGATPTQSHQLLRDACLIRSVDGSVGRSRLRTVRRVVITHTQYRHHRGRSYTGRRDDHGAPAQCRARGLRRILSSRLTQTTFESAAIWPDGPAYSVSAVLFSFAGGAGRAWLSGMRRVITSSRIFRSVMSSMLPGCGGASCVSTLVGAPAGRPGSAQQ